MCKCHDETHYFILLTYTNIKNVTKSSHMLSNTLYSIKLHSSIQIKSEQIKIEIETLINTDRVL